MSDDGWDDEGPIGPPPDKGDADLPIHIIKKDGRQYWAHPDGTREDIPPDSPDYYHRSKP